MRSPRRFAQRGAGSVEFVIIFVLFAALITGLFEMTRVFRTKHTLNTATFMAARAGSVHNALSGPMNAELADNMAELFMHGGDSAEAFTAALGRAQVFGQALANIGGGVIIVSPTQKIFNKLRKRQWIRRSDEDDYKIQRVIPNDNLRWRPRQTATLDDNRKINLQDANLLKVRSVWCHRLLVPGLDRLIYSIVNSALFSLENLQPINQRQAVCTTLTETLAGTGGIPNAYYLAVSSKAVIRMQSPIVDDDL